MMATESEIVRLHMEDRVRVADLAVREGCSREAIYLILRRHDIRGHKPVAEKPVPPKRAPVGKRAYGSVQRRHVAPTADPSSTRDLAPRHPAVIEGRTLFPSTVVGTFASPRFLVSGVNSPKTGGRVTKGPWTDFPIFTLTLEERKTCPASCPVWSGCYGNGMHHARRNDALDEDFIPALAAEVITVARQHPDGLVIRLHILGDFFSVPYVRMWGYLLDMLPMLHVFGYTARRQDRDDAESQEIAAEIKRLTNAQWDRFAIRWSHDEFVPQGSVVVMADPKLPDVIVCPAQSGASECCASCGLCWAEAARHKTIAFLKHGNSRLGRSGK